MPLTRSSAAHAQDRDPSAGTRAQKLSPKHVAPDESPRVLRDRNKNGARSADALAAKEKVTAASVKVGRKRKAELLEEGSNSAMDEPSGTASVAGGRANKVQKLATSSTNNMRTTRSSSRLSDRPTPLATRQTLPIRRASAPSLELRSRTPVGQQGHVRDKPDVHSLNKKVGELQKVRYQPLACGSTLHKLPQSQGINQAQKITKDQTKV